MSAPVVPLRSRSRSRSATRHDPAGGPRRARLLFVAECVTLAHLGRLAVLAERLDRTRFDIHIASDPRGHRFLAHLGLPLHTISTISSSSFQQALARGRRPYELDVLAQYAEEDLALIEAVRPDVVVGDFRLSLTASARAAQVPYVNVTNAYWSPFARLEYPMPAHPLVELFGLRMASAVAPIARPLTFANYVKPLNDLRQRYGLRPLPRDVRHAYVDGDLTLFSDAAEHVDFDGSPSHHRFLGPLVWSVPGIPEPASVAALAAEHRLVYVTLGSSGMSKALAPVIEGLARLPVGIVVATAGAPVPHSLPRDRVIVADLLPGEALARRASLVVCNGGSATAHQALAAGTPVLGVASNMDQFLTMTTLERTGAVRCLRADRVGADDVERAAMAMLAQQSVKTSAADVGALFASYDPAARFVDALESMGMIPGTHSEMNQAVPETSRRNASGVL